jgi:hypothetical protein
VQPLIDVYQRLSLRNGIKRGSIWFRRRGVAATTINNIWLAILVATRSHLPHLLSDRILGRP